MQLDNQYAVGTYAGTGVAQTITLGFKPIFFLSWNETDGTTFTAFLSGLAAGSAYTVVTTAGPALISSNGYTATANGMTVGTATSVNTNAKTYRYIAF